MLKRGRVYWRLLRPASVALVVLAGVGIGWAGHAQALLLVCAAHLKVTGRADGCPWPQVLGMAWSQRRLADLMWASERVLSVEAFDPQFGIEKIASPHRSFWIRQAGDQKNGRQLLAYLLAEQEWMAQATPESRVRQGEVVLDCGAHVGVFTEDALRRGAAQVVAIEPDAVNLECLRRNFAREIASGRVVVVPSGVWSSKTKLAFSASRMNSGSGSLVVSQDGEKIEVPVTTIDAMVQELHLRRVDYIKMDIEGAEREALRGTAQTLGRFRPRLMLETYHLADDMLVLPQIVRQARPDYSHRCGPCEHSEYGTLVLHMVYFH